LDISARISNVDALKLLIQTLEANKSLLEMATKKEEAPTEAV
jgi:hypothetical protein